MALRTNRAKEDERIASRTRLPSYASCLWLPFVTGARGFRPSDAVPHGPKKGGLMKRHLSILVVAAGTAALATGLAFAAKKPPANAPFVPEIGYTYASGNYEDVRLANRDGSQAILVHRTAFGALGGFDLSRDDVRRIAYVDLDAGGVFVRAWSDTGGNVSVSAPTTIYSGSDFPHGVDFSPDGSRLAYGVSGTNPGLYIYSFADGSTQSFLQDRDVFDPRWDPVGGHIYFWSGSPDGSLAIYKYDLASSSVTPLIPVPAGQFSNYDLTRPTGNSADTRLIVDQRDANDEPMMLGLWTSDGQFDRDVTDGTKAHFNCSNSEIIHHDWAIRRVPVAVTNVATGVTSRWSGDSNIRRTDWLPRAVCA